MSDRDRAVRALSEFNWPDDPPDGNEAWLLEIIKAEVDVVAAALGITFDADGKIDAPFFVPQWVDTGPALMLGIPEDVPIDTTATYYLIRKADD